MLCYIPVAQQASEALHISTYTQGSLPYMEQLSGDRC